MQVKHAFDEAEKLVNLDRVRYVDAVPRNNDHRATMKTQQAQFANLEQFALKAPKPKEGNDRIWSVGEVLNEANRKPGNSRHVERAEKPTWHCGSKEQVESRASAWHEQAREGSGKTRRRLRRTSPSVACAVVSMKRDHADDWPSFCVAVIDYFVGAHGERVVGAVQHLDEAHPHLHVYLVALDGEGFGVVHPGYAASRLARIADGNHVGTTYRAAMRLWQDEFHAACGVPFGLRRLGPERPRLSRTEWVASKKAAQIVALAEAQAAMAIAAARQLAAKAQARGREAECLERDAVSAMKLLQSRQELFASTNAGLTTAKLASLEAALASSAVEMRTLKNALDASMFRNAEHERLARAAGRRETESAIVEVGRQTLTPFSDQR